jgi:predicted PurR-regulated permease PerM
LILILGVFVPVLIDELRKLIDFIVTVAQAPEGPTAYLRTIADQYEFGWLFDRLSGQLSDLPSQLGDLAKWFLLSAGGIAISAAGFVASLVTILTLTFFMILSSERLVNGSIRLFPEVQQPLVRSILRQSAGAVSGYISGNLAISFIAGVTTFILLVALGMPYPAALALLVAVLDLIPLVGATLAATIVVVVALLVAWWKALILLVFFLVYQQFEGSVLQPLVYSRAVHLDGLTIFSAVLVGGLLLGIPGALLAIPVAEIIRIVVTDSLAYRHAPRSEEEEKKPAVSSPSLQPPT